MPFVNERQTEGAKNKQKTLSNQHIHNTYSHGFCGVVNNVNNSQYTQNMTFTSELFTLSNPMIHFLHLVALTKTKHNHSCMRTKQNINFILYTSYFINY